MDDVRLINEAYGKTQGRFGNLKESLYASEIDAIAEAISSGEDTMPYMVQYLRRQATKIERIWSAKNLADLRKAFPEYDQDTFEQHITSFVDDADIWNRFMQGAEQ
jgi:hypothetical protein